MQINAAAQDRLELLEVDRLGQIVERSQFDGASGVGAIAIARHHDDLGRRRRTQELPEREEPLLSRVRMRRQPEIEADDVRAYLVHERECRGATLGEEQRVFLAERVFELRPNGLVVLDDQQLPW